MNLQSAMGSYIVWEREVWLSNCVLMFSCVRIVSLFNDHLTINLKAGLPVVKQQKGTGVGQSLHILWVSSIFVVSRFTAHGYLTSLVPVSCSA